jgi:hypothetical protein
MAAERHHTASALVQYSTLRSMNSIPMRLSILRRASAAKASWISLWKRRAFDDGVDVRPFIVHCSRTVSRFSAQ